MSVGSPTAGTWSSSQWRPDNEFETDRRQWRQASGYHRQGRVENTFFRYKSIIGDGLRARSSAGQGSEAVLGCEILNRMTAIGRPVSYRIGR